MNMIFLSCGESTPEGQQVAPTTHFTGISEFTATALLKKKRESERKGIGERERIGERWEEVGRKSGEMSNSKRHAAFPWQHGFHRNGLTKDAIRVKKHAHTHTGNLHIYINTYSILEHLALKHTQSHTCTHTH